MSNQAGGAMTALSAMIAEEKSFDAASIMVSANPMASSPDVKVHFTQKMTQSSLVKQETLADQKAPVRSLSSNIKSLLKNTPLLQNLAKVDAADQKPSRVFTADIPLSNDGIFKQVNLKQPLVTPINQHSVLSNPSEAYTDTSSSDYLEHLDYLSNEKHGAEIEALDDFIYVMLVQFKSNGNKESSGPRNEGSYIPMNAISLEQPNMIQAIDSVSVSKEVSDELLGLMQEFISDKNGDLQQLFQGKALPGSSEFKHIMSKIYGKADSLHQSQKSLYRKFLNTVFQQMDSLMLGNQESYIKPKANLDKALGGVSKDPYVTQGILAVKDPQVLNDMFMSKDPYLVQEASQSEPAPLSQDIFTAKDQAVILSQLMSSALNYSSE